MSKDAFIRVYSNLPEDIRKEIIVIINNKPYSWDASYLEINKETKLGNHILKKLIDMELI